MKRGFFVKTFLSVVLISISIGLIGSYLVHPAYAQTIQWTRQFGSFSAEAPSGVALDALGVYVVGSRPYPGPFVDGFVRKFDFSGNLLWDRTIDSGAEDAVAGVAVDSSGIYVAGSTTGSLEVSSTGVEISFGGRDAFVRKYDLSGTLLWTRQDGTSGDDAALAVAADASGVYVVEQAPYGSFVLKFDPNGNFAWQVGPTEPALAITAGFDPTYPSGIYYSGQFSTSCGCVSSIQAYVQKTDSNGIDRPFTTPFGSDVFGTSGTDSASSVAVDPSGVFVTGWTDGTFPGETSYASVQTFLRRYDLNGAVLWTHQFGHTQRGSASHVTVDTSGIYVAESDALDVAIFKFDFNGNFVWTRQFGEEFVGEKFSGIASDASGIYLAGVDRGAGAALRRYDVNGNVIWTRQSGPAVDEQAFAVDHDGSDPVVAGDTGGALKGQTSAGGFDAYIREYDPDGTERFTTQFGTSGDDFAFDLAVSGSDIYVVGVTSGTFTGQTSSGQNDIFIRKYCCFGAEQWTRQFGTSGFDSGFAVATDLSGANVYVAGYTGGALPGQTYSGATDAFIRKYDSLGNVVWTREFGSSGQDSVTGLAVDSSGLYLVGSTGGTIPGETSLGKDDVFIRKYDFAGNVVWTHQFGTPENEGGGRFGGPDVAVDSSGVYVTGLTTGAFSGETNSGQEDVFILKFDSLGNVVWTREFGTSGSDSPSGVALDSSGVYVTGGTSGAFPGETNVGSSDAFVARVSQDGSLLWVQQFGTDSPDGATGITWIPGAPFSHVYVAGSTFGTFPGEIGGQIARCFSFFLCGQDAFLVNLAVSPSDVTPPTIILQGDITVEATGPTGATVTYTVTAQDDVDGPVTPVCSPDSGSTFALGKTTVSCSATDSAGNSATTSFTVTVADRTSPDIFFDGQTGKFFIITVEAQGTSGAYVNYPPITAQDSVDPPNPVVTCNPPSGSLFPVEDPKQPPSEFAGGNVQCTASDSAGNQASIEILVTVVDTTPPILSLPPNIVTSTTDPGGIAVIYAASANDIVDGSVDPGCLPASGSVFPVGTTTVTCTATDNHLNKATATFKVTVFQLTGTPGGSATIDQNGNTVITGTDSSGNTVTTVVLPPGTTVGSGASVNFTSKGANGMTQVTGVTLPFYPPGKTITTKSNPGTSKACVVDSPDKVSLETVSCKEDIFKSTIVLDCSDTGTTRTVPFPDSLPPTMRTYTCTKSNSGGQNYLTVSGLAYSTLIIDGTPPIITLPSITVEATGPGTPVFFTATAMDDLGTTSDPTCSPMFGSLFPVGATTVTCESIDWAGNVGTATFVVTVVDTTPPSTIISTGTPQFVSGGSTYVSSNTLFTLTASDLVGVHETRFGVDDSSTPDSYSNPFAIPSKGTHTIYFHSTDQAGNTEATKSIAVVVGATRTTYTGAVSGTYSDPVSLSASLIEMATQQPIPGPGKSISFTLGSQSASAITDQTGSATANLVLNQAAGSYAVSASFAGDATFQPSSVFVRFSIFKESAQVSYTGDTIVPTTANPINLRVTGIEDRDGSLGDISRLKVTIKIFTSTDIAGLGTPLRSIGPLSLLPTGVPGLGVVSSPTANLPEGEYIIIVYIDARDNQYYAGPTSDPTPLTVFEPTGSFITGGGSINDPSSSDNHGNFGMVARYTKSGQPKGQSVYVFRQAGLVYIIKSNAVIGLAISGSCGSFQAKATLQIFDPSTGQVMFSDGNYQMTTKACDNTGTMTNSGIDTYSISVLDKNGLPYHSAGGNLQGGNITIHTATKTI